MNETVSEIRIFNSEGQNAFRELLQQKPKNFKTRLGEICQDEKLTVAQDQLNLSWSLPVYRRDVGNSLFRILGPDGPLRSVSSNSGLWDWLSAVFLAKQARPQEIVTNVDHWAFNDLTNRFYRHEFFSSFFLYESHFQHLSEIEGLLFRKLGDPRGELLEQILGTPDIAHSVGARVACKLYYDPARRALKSGASGKGPGSPRRLTAAYLNQIKLNVDFKAMSVEALMESLPSEFDRFKYANDSASEGALGGSGDEVDFDDLRSQVNF